MPTPQEKMATQAKLDKAIELRAKGWLWDDIAAEVGYKHRSNCIRAVMKELRRRHQEAGVGAEELAQMEEERLRQAERRVWRDSDEMSPRDLVDAVVKIHDKRVNLHGIGARFEMEADKAEALAVLSSALFRAIEACGLEEEQQQALLTHIAGELEAGA